MEENKNVTESVTNEEDENVTESVTNEEDENEQPCFHRFVKFKSKRRCIHCGVTIQ